MTLRSPLLKRQLRRSFGPDFEREFETHSQADVSINSAALQRLLQSVDEAYWQQQRDLDLRTRSLELSSQEMNEALREAEKANALKGRFVANISHELRTPIHGIRGVVQLLARGETDPRRLRLLDAAGHSAQLLLAIVNDLLDFARIEAGEMRANVTVFDLRPWFDAMVGALRHRVESRGLVFVTDLAGDLPTQLQSDALRLEQVVSNLVSNAAKFTEQGEVRVNVSLAEPGRLHIAVTDSGIGIPPERQLHLFKAFSQVDDSATRRHGGTGLGLAISAELCRLLGGDITVQSEPGRGSTFLVDLPLVPPPAPEPVPTA